METTINSLDPSQKSTLESILSGNSNNVVVYGPPGTGKSHLIVSLLFELAAKGKKVLFVSQNSEALNVIIRKYKSLHQELGLSEQDLSFMDFCWRLNSREQKRLKYLRNIFNNRTGKTTQNVRFTSSKTSSNNLPPYNITYTELDAIRNMNVRPQIVGADELVAANVKYLTMAEVTPATLKNLDRIDTRYILDLLNSYSDPNNNFSKYNHPNNQLKFFSKNNDQITLGAIRTHADAICSVDGIISNNTTYKVIGAGVTVQNYLSNLLQIATTARYLKYDRVKQKPELLDEIYDDLTKAIKINNSLYSVELISLPDGLTDEILGAYKGELSALATSKDLALRLKAREVLNRKLVALQKKYGFNGDVTVENLLAYCVKKIKYNFKSLFDGEDFLTFCGMNEKALSALLADINGYNQKGTFSKLFASLPETILQFKETSQDDILQNADYIKTAINMLKGTEADVSYLYKNSVSRKFGVIPDPFENSIPSVNQLIELVNYLISVVESTPYSLIENNTISEIAVSSAELSEQSKIILDALNKNKLSVANMWEVVEKINQNVENNKNREKINAIFSSWKDVLNLSKENFITEAENIIDYISTNRGAILSSISSISDVPEKVVIDAEKITELENALNNSLDENIFAQNLYEMKEGDNLNTWQKRVETILEYNNIDEFEEYMGQMAFLDKIKEAFTPANLKIILDLLSEDSIKYETFAGYLTNDVVSSALYNMSKNNNPKIPKDYFETYSKRISDRRRLRYLNELSGMRASSAKEAQYLSYATNWFGTSTMEKIRNNTAHLIKAFPVVIATPSDVSKYIAPQKEIFDYVIFDEASQLLPGQALPSIYRAKRAVIVGDPHQMPPTAISMLGSSFSMSEDDEEDMGASILDVAVNLPDLEAHHLKIHYRSESNKLFEPSLTAIYSHDGIRPIFEAKSGTMPIYIEDNIGEDENRGYASIIRRVNHYLNNNLNASFCVLFSRGSGVGSLYGFRKYLESHPENTKDIMEMCESERLLMSTVTNCQGIQGHHTIIYLPTYNVISRMWFFNEKAGAYKRLNVSITRQTKTLDLIMGDSKNKWINTCQGFIQSQNTPPNTLLSATLLNSLLTNAGQVIDYEYLNNSLSGNVAIIDNPLTKSIYDQLMKKYENQIGKTINIWCEIGWNILIPDAIEYGVEHRNVGYRIDIGIYSIAKKRFVLGIEVDGSTYHKGFDMEFSDLQRQETLKRKGWNIYRIWSTNWLRNTKGEFDALTEAIDTELEKEEPVELVETDYDDDLPELDEEEEEKIIENIEPIEPIKLPESGEEEEIVPAKKTLRSELGPIMFQLALVKIVDQRLRLGMPLTILLDDGGETRKIYLKKKESDGFLGSEELGGAVRKYKYDSVFGYQE